MKGITARFSKTIYERIRLEAEIEGVSMSHWVAEAALARMIFQRGHRGEIPPEFGPELKDAIRDYVSQERSRARSSQP